MSQPERKHRAATREEDKKELKTQLRSVDHEIKQEEVYRQRIGTGPMSGGMVTHQRWALERARVLLPPLEQEHHERRREEQRPSLSQPSEKHKVEVAKSEVKERTAAQLQEERARSAARPRELERDEERQRQEREQQREEQRLNPAQKPEAEHKIDFARYSSDPDYRREMKERAIAQNREGRQQQRTQQQRELERDDRQR